MRILILAASALLAGCAVQAGEGAQSTPSLQANGKIFESPHTGMKFVRIEGGSFTMGTPADEEFREADETQHQVLISQPFYLGTYEVTRKEWKAVMGSQPWKGMALAPEGDQMPANYVNWEDAQAFVNRLNRLEGTDAYRLPTEAEWEYAARAGSTGPFPGDPFALGWFADNSGRTRVDAMALWDDDHEVRLRRILANGALYHSVGGADPNPWGLHDMHGNVWEWVHDWHGSYPVGPVTDPTGPASGTRRSVRGGSWSLPFHYGRSGSRDQDPPEHLAPALGFRIARDVE